MTEFTLPRRVQLSRVKGFRLQQHVPGAVAVRRPTRWGNPFTIASVLKDDPTLTPVQARECATGLFGLWLDGALLGVDGLAERRTWILEHLGDLTGRPLACTCPLPSPGAIDWCHGRVLIERANEPAEPIPPLTTAWATVYAPRLESFRHRETVRFSPEAASLL